MSKIQEIVVFGLGAAGANFLQHMAYAHPAMKFAGVDFDVVEQRNYEAGTQPYTKGDLNRTKVQAMQRILGTNRTAMRGHTVKILSSEQLSGIGGVPSSSLLVDAFDNAESRNLFLALKGIHNVLHIGFSPSMTGEAVWAESYSEMTPDKTGSFDVCQMNVARPFIHALTAIAALVATEFIETGSKRNAYFDSKLKMFTF